MKVGSEFNSTIDGMIQEGVSCLKRGGVIAFPTESYYGLGVDPFSEAAVDCLFRLKKRAYHKGIILLIAEKRMLEDLVAYIPDEYGPLIDRFWPGPLTLLFPAGKNIAQLLKGNTTDIGIRISSNPIAHRLCEKWGRPVTATSANISGDFPARSAGDLIDIFGKYIDVIIDGGCLHSQSASTIIGYENGDIRYVREGLIPYREIAQII